MRVNNIKQTTVLSLAVLTLGACSTVVSGTTQPFSVKTEKVSGAKCELVDSKDSRWIIPDTPGTVEITKGDGPLTVTCSKGGYKTASLQVEETFAGATLGNVLLGGGIGIIVDAASGAAQEYPDEVIVWLEPKSWASEQAKQDWYAERDALQEKLRQEAEARKPKSENGEQYN